MTNRLAPASAYRTSWATRRSCVFHLYCHPHVIQDVELGHTVCTLCTTSASATLDSMEIRTRAALKTSHAALPPLAEAMPIAMRRVTSWNAAAQRDYKGIHSLGVMTSMNASVLAASVAPMLVASTPLAVSSAFAQMEWSEIHCLPALLGDRTR